MSLGPMGRQNVVIDARKRIYGVIGNTGPGQIDKATCVYVSEIGLLNLSTLVQARPYDDRRFTL
jgi:hypothetical protein